MQSLRSGCPACEKLLEIGDLVHDLCDERFIREKLMRLRHIGEVHSHIAVTEIKNTTRLPLDTQL